MFRNAFFLLSSFFQQEIIDKISSKGSHGIDAGPLKPDATFSQGPIVVAGNLIFAVNVRFASYTYSGDRLVIFSRIKLQPGSNSVSMFNINPFNPVEIKMVGEPVSSGGEFPVSLAVSPVNGDGECTPVITIPNLNKITY